MFRRLIILAGVAVLACALAAPALAVRVKVRVESQTTTIYGTSEPALTTGTNALAVLDAASIAGEFYYHVTTTSFGPFVDQIGLYPGAGFNGWSFKINGVSPPVGADQAAVKDGDTVLWYWSTFTPQGGSPTLLLKRRAARNCYSVLSQNDLGQTEPASGARLLVDGRRVAGRAGRWCVGRHHGLVRAVAANAVRSNALR